MAFSGLYEGNSVKSLIGIRGAGNPKKKRKKKEKKNSTLSWKDSANAGVGDLNFERRKAVRVINSVCVLCRRCLLISQFRRGAVEMWQVIGTDDKGRCKCI